jgi:hypothetical protein
MASVARPVDRVPAQTCWPIPLDETHAAARGSRHRPSSGHICELLGYLERNEELLVHYAARRRRGEPISTAFVESAVNEIVAKRMNKKQQMGWNRTTVQSFLDVRTAVLNDALEDAFRYRYPGFRSANDDQVRSVAA